MLKKKLLIDNSDLPYLENKYIFIDNDFLGTMFDDQDIFMDFVTAFKRNFLIAPFTVFEFLRDVFLPQVKKNKQDFIFSNGIFIAEMDHPEIYFRLKDNALILSQIYSREFHKNRSSSKKNAASMVDLFLAARLMDYGTSCVLVTGNKKDFPSFIFDTRCVFNYELPDGSMRAISIVEFNKEKFESCYKDLLEMEEKFGK